VRLKIAIVVHGRFHSFDLARALIERGHDVTIFTNYPKWAVEKFGVAKERVRSCWHHGVLSRATQKLNQTGVVRYPESRLHSSFSRWAAAELEREDWDVIHIWSGVAEEVLKKLKGSSSLKFMMRGSAHILTQAQLLWEEEQRTGVPQDRPSQWMIAREIREYELADCIVTLSTFAYESFVAQGIPRSKLERLPLGANLKSFRPGSEIVKARCQRILSGEALQVLCVGTLSFRKGLKDLSSIFYTLRDERYKFRFVGAIAREAEHIRSSLEGLVEFIPKRPQHELPEWYSWGDVFIFPTIEDGYAVVLAQAHANALPIIATTNCGGPDLLQDRGTGWILPIREPDAFIERLRWCDANRGELANMVRRIYGEFKSRDWSDVAADFEFICLSYLRKRDSAATGNG
jgi:glycosyltransferase involved in cell wall biosynthesis